MKYLTLLFTFFFLLSALSCCKEEVPLCSTPEGEECKNGFLSINGNCSCPNDTHFQLGEDLPEEYCKGGLLFNGACIEKINLKDSIYNYLLYTDCGCTEYFNGPDTFVVTFGEDNHVTPFYVRIKNNRGDIIKEKRLDGLGAIESGHYYRNENEGDYFILQNIFPFGTGNVNCEASFDPSVEGLVIGIIEGQFNEDDTKCDATFYWRIKENGEYTIFDSCQWHLRR